MSDKGHIPNINRVFRSIIIGVAYGSAMIYVDATTWDWVIALVGWYVGIWLHEGSHYFVGWLGESDPRLIFKLAVVPLGVEHRNIETVDSVVIRLSGLSVFLWIPIFVFTVWRSVLQQSPEALIMMGPFAVATLMATTSDAIALLEPERYRELEVSDEVPSDSLWGI